MKKLIHENKSIDTFDLSLVPQSVFQLHELLGPQKSYIVGGMIRDTIRAYLNQTGASVQRALGYDWDIATPLRPPEVIKRLKQAKITVIPVGIEHGTVAAILDGHTYEITTFRHDVEYHDGRHATVRFADTLEEDLERRDFTVNAFAVDLETGAIIDLFSGIKDLQVGLIRAVGDAETRFREDYLRMLRAVRFTAKLHGSIERETREAIKRNAHLIQHISAERIRDELMKLLTYEKPSHGFTLMREIGLLHYILPELDQCFDVGQNRFHSDDVAMHTLRAMDAISPKYPFLRWIALVHDLGKTPAKQYLPRKKDYVFYGHQYLSKKIGKRIMKRLRFSNKDIETTSSIVENHMYNLKPGLSLAAARRFLRRLGRENVDAYLRVRMADRRGNKLNSDGYEKGIFHFLRSVRAIDRAEDALKVTDLHITGYDLIEMGLKPGPVFSVILNQLLEEVLDEPEHNEREWLLRRAEEFCEEYKQTGTITLPERASTDEEETGE